MNDIENVSVRDLNYDPSNVRTHSSTNLASIKASLLKFGQQKPIVVNHDNIVIAGNGTLEAARELGWDTIACVRTALAGSQATAFAIADNRTAELADWDTESLTKQLAAIRDEDSNLFDACGFSTSTLDEMLSQLATSLSDFDDKQSPDDFKDIEESQLEHKCPKCGFEFDEY